MLYFLEEENRFLTLLAKVPLYGATVGNPFAVIPAFPVEPVLRWRSAAGLVRPERRIRISSQRWKTLGSPTLEGVLLNGSDGPALFSLVCLHRYRSKSTGTRA